MCTVTPNDGTEDVVISTDSMTSASKCELTDCDVNLDFGGDLALGSSPSWIVQDRLVGYL